MPEWQQLLDDLGDEPVRFGLAAQGHLPTIARMLSEGASWQEIGRAIGWCPETAERHYRRHLEHSAEI